MTVKRFTVQDEKVLKDNQKYVAENGYVFSYKSDAEEVCNLLNELYEENEQLKYNLAAHMVDLNNYTGKCSALEIENEQLKQDNNALIHLLENQSMIIQELHSKLLEYQIQEPIVLTKEDLELMGKAISYYTHGRYAE